jgi:membrane dipeptidase
MTRQEFLRHSSLVLGGALLSSACGRIGQSVAIPVFDLHTHPGPFFYKGTPNDPGDQAFIDRIQDMKTAGLNGAFFSLVADLPLLRRTDTGIVPTGTFEPDEGWAVFTGQLSILKALLSQSGTEWALAGEDLRAGDSFRAYIAVEGGDFLEGSVERVGEAYAVGVRSIQLVHYAPNDLGDLQTSAASYNGLSRFGKNVVRAMNDRGMLIDVAHASEATVKAVTDLTSAPILLSHSILQDGLDRPVAARAITPVHAQMVADTGGVIGMWPSGFSISLDEFVDHTKRMVDLVGIDHVGIGTDMDANFKPVISNYKEFFSWKDALATKGFSEKEVAKIAGGNAHRLLREVLT